MFKTEAAIISHTEQKEQGSGGNAIWTPSLQLLEELKQRLGTHGVQGSE